MDHRLFSFIIIEVHIVVISHWINVVR